MSANSCCQSRFRRNFFRGRNRLVWVKLQEQLPAVDEFCNASMTIGACHVTFLCSRPRGFLIQNLGPKGVFAGFSGGRVHIEDKHKRRGEFICRNLRWCVFCFTCSLVLVGEGRIFGDSDGVLSFSFLLFFSPLNEDF